LRVNADVNADVLGKNYDYCINFPKILQLLHVLVENSSPKAGVYGANSKAIPQSGIALAPGSRLPAPGSRLPAPGSRLPAPGSRLPAPGYTLLKRRRVKRLIPDFPPFIKISKKYVKFTHSAARTPYPLARITCPLARTPQPLAKTIRPLARIIYPLAKTARSGAVIPQWKKRFTSNRKGGI
jgi:hypothetical protein